jgi:prepilin-type N-terminal cleavage/methylation domain-containing protein
MNRDMKRLHQHGFTLIELLLTMAISTVLLCTIAALVGQSTKGYTVSQRAVDQISEARSLIQLLEHELSTRLPDTPLIHRSDKPDQIAWFRVISNHEEKTNHPGDLSMNYYYLYHVEEPDGRIRPKLLRKCISPELTQQILENRDDASFPEPEPTKDEVVLEQVLGFSMTPYYHDPSSQMMESWNGQNQPPAETIVMELKLIDDAAAKYISDTDEWKRVAGSPSPEEVPYIRTFTHTFYLTR